MSLGKEAIAQRLFDRAYESLSRRNWINKLLDRLMADCMANDGLRTQLFRYADVFPVLRTPEAVNGHFRSYIGPHQNRFPFLLQLAVWFVGKPGAGYFSASAIGYFMKLFAKRFIIDSTDEKVLAGVGQKLRSGGYDITWDILGEEALTQKEADNFRERYLALIRRLGSSPAPEGFSNNVSVKLSSLVPKFSWDPINQEGCVRRVSGIFSELLQEANRCKVAINVDMEQYAVRDLTMEIFKYSLNWNFNVQNAGIVIQAYLRDSEKALADLLRWIEKYRCPVVIRLVKGAYWDWEVINAEQQRWPIPVLLEKEKTDRRFAMLAEKILKAQKSGLPVRLACASHNLKSIAEVMAMTEELGIGKEEMEFQVLYGMGDPVREAIVSAGYRLRVYTPYGDLMPSMAYLVRRLLENTSQQSFLGLTFLKKAEKKEAANV